MVRKLIRSKSEWGSYRYDGETDMKVLRKRAEAAVRYFNKGGKPRVDMETNVFGYPFSIIDNGKLVDKENAYKGNVIIRALSYGGGIYEGKVTLSYNDDYNDGRGQGGSGSVLIGDVRDVSIKDGYLVISGIDMGKPIAYRYLIQEKPDEKKVVFPIPKGGKVPSDKPFINPPAPKPKTEAPKPKPKAAGSRVNSTLDDFCKLLYDVSLKIDRAGQWCAYPYNGKKNPIYTQAELVKRLSDKKTAYETATMFMDCYLSHYSEHWGEWPKFGVTYEEWKSVQKRLREIRQNNPKPVMSWEEAVKVLEQFCLEHDQFHLDCDKDSFSIVPQDDRHNPVFMGKYTAKSDKMEVYVNARDGMNRKEIPKDVGELKTQLDISFTAFQSKQSKRKTKKQSSKPFDREWILDYLDKYTWAELVEEKDGGKLIPTDPRFGGNSVFTVVFKNPNGTEIDIHRMKLGGQPGDNQNIYKVRTWSILETEFATAVKAVNKFLKETPPKVEKPKKSVPKAIPKPSVKPVPKEKPKKIEKPKPAPKPKVEKPKKVVPKKPVTKPAVKPAPSSGMVYTVKANGLVKGTFSSRTKAEALKRDLKKDGFKAQVLVSFA